MPSNKPPPSPEKSSAPDTDQATASDVPSPRPPAAASIANLVAVMAALRTPVTGCPWDLEQTYATIAPYTIEEAYEVADAIARSDTADLKEELGDLLLQVVYHAQMASEDRAFTIDDVTEAITAKMIRRHPHVFGDAATRSAGAAKGFWETIKAEEKRVKEIERTRLAAVAAKSATAPRAKSLLDDVPLAFPALTRAIKLQDKAARVGFDWPSLGPVLDKMKEELAELEAELRPHSTGGCASAHEAASIDQRINRADAGPDVQWASEGPTDGSSEAPINRTDATSASEARINRADAKWASEARINRADAKWASEARIKEEFGDLLFVMANVARHLKIDPEAALSAANHKFTRRFHHIEQELAKAGKTPAQSDLAEMDALWNDAKRVLPDK